MPYAQHDVLGGWLLDQAGLDRTGSACRTVAVFPDTGSSAVVPWARDASHVVALINTADAHEPQWKVANLPISSFAVENAHNLAGEPRDVLTLSTFPSEGVVVAPETVAELELRSSLAGLLLSGGAAQRIVELAVEHANTRSQFGRVLSRFQAVQQLVADLAAEAALVHTVAAVAARTASDLGFEHPRTGFGHRCGVVERSAFGVPDRSQRAPGAGGHRIHQRARPAPLHEPAVVLAFRSGFDP